eukprot:TRINITY_DN39534_c0_g1_i1.p1 TRINITY_DN39534_c0_g1~~TRINITY_DN39534_c0_g1_i1.p1  ORF type:complete len:559 (+),score=51.65 TRINITY_DN39534_c0_g1_i1:99-1775(+)
MNNSDDHSQMSGISFAFIFPMASGHVNPSLPIARTLTEKGHRVHYLCREQMREAIVDTGAMFHSDIVELEELYDGREPFMFGALMDLQKEYGLENEHLMRAWLKLKEIQVEMMLPGLIRWLRKIKADVVVCCSLLSIEAVYGAKYLNIPCVGLLTTAGPGNSEIFLTDTLKQIGMSVEDVLLDRKHFQPLMDSIHRLQTQYGLSIEVDEGLQPLGILPSIMHSALTLVTTADFLQDPLSVESARRYDDAGCNIVYVGPLLDRVGAKRAAGHRYAYSAIETKAHASNASEDDPLSKLKAARASGRSVIYVSMGTMLTGDTPEWGWNERITVDGRPKGFTGKELCQSAWRGAFDAFGSQSIDNGPLLLVALGPQHDALDGVALPANALCLPTMPQVDLLKAGVDLFLTHGGQNSFMEALAAGVPMVVCPGFGDQHVNARRAESIGVGRHVERPIPELEHVFDTAETYRRDVAAALREVFENPSFKIEAGRCAGVLRLAGGVQKATELILELTQCKHLSSDVSDEAKHLPTLLNPMITESRCLDSRKPAANDSMKSLADSS